MNGKSSTAFAPEAKITRARLWTILARWEDVDLTGGKKWYSKARAWAKNKGNFGWQQTKCCDNESRGDHNAMACARKTGSRARDSF